MLPALSRSLPRLSSTSSYCEGWEEEEEEEEDGGKSLPDGPSPTLTQPHLPANKFDDTPSLSRSSVDYRCSKSNGVETDDQASSAGSTTALHSEQTDFDNDTPTVDVKRSQISPEANQLHNHTDNTSEVSEILMVGSHGGKTSRCNGTGIIRNRSGAFSQSVWNRCEAVRNGGGRVWNGGEGIRNEDQTLRNDGQSMETNSQGVWNGGEAVWNGGGMVWNGDRSVQNDTQHKSASNTHKIPLRKRYTASDELDVIQLQTACEEPTPDPSVLLKLYQFLSLGYSARLTSSPYIREILSNCGTTSEAQNYRRSYILEGL